MKRSLVFDTTWQMLARGKYWSTFSKEMKYTFAFVTVAKIKRLSYYEINNFWKTEMSFFSMTKTSTVNMFNHNRDNYKILNF